MEKTPEQKPDSPAKHKYKLFAMGAIGTFMSTLDGSILNVALPTIGREFSVSIDSVAWVVLSYSLTLVSLMLVFGAWGGKRGYGFAYKFGYSFFLIGSVICIVSSTMPILLTGRVIQAIGAAMFAAVGPGMVTSVFPKAERGKGIGMMVMMVAAGLMTGPPLGGFLLSYFSWHVLFLINIPIGILGLILVFRYNRFLQPPADPKPIHFGGAISISVALLCGMGFLSLMNDLGFSDYRLWSLAVIAVIASMTFFRFESRPKTALVGLHLLRNRQFMSAIIAMTTMFIAISGVLVIGPFYLEQVMGFEPKQVGLFLMILPLTMLFAAPTSGRISDKIGYRFLTTFGTIVLAVGLYMIAQFSANSSTSYIVYSLLTLGLGVGIFNTPNSSALMSSVDPEERAVVSGILGTTRNVGMSFGVALSTGFFAYFQQIALKNGELAPFMGSYNKVVIIAIFVSFIGIPFCMTRKNKLSG